jgi:hypothetical protein
MPAPRPKRNQDAPTSGARWASDEVAVCCVRPHRQTEWNATLNANGTAPGRQAGASFFVVAIRSQDGEVVQWNCFRARRLKFDPKGEIYTEKTDQNCWH